jgi:integrase
MLYSLAMATGLRQGELLGLAWDDLDLDTGSLTVRRTLQRYGGAFHLDPPKTKRSRRTLSVSLPLVAALKVHRKRQLEERLRAGNLWQGETWRLVFLSETGEPMWHTTIRNRLREALGRAGLPMMRFHDMRHAAATYMLAQGVSLRTAMEVLGHSTIAVTANTYSHVMPELVRDAGERVSTVLFGDE